MAESRRKWGGALSVALVRLTLATYGRTCHLCGRPGATSADHVIPRSRGGPDTIGNLRPCHRRCNYQRGDRTLDEWFAAHPLPSATIEPSREW